MSKQFWLDLASPRGRSPERRLEGRNGIAECFLDALLVRLNTVDYVLDIQIDHILSKNIIWAD